LAEFLSNKLACAVDVRSEIEVDETIEIPAAELERHTKHSAVPFIDASMGRADQSLDLFGRHAVRLGQDRYGRRSQIGKDIHGRPQRDDAP